MGNWDYSLSNKDEYIYEKMLWRSISSSMLNAAVTAQSIVSLAPRATADACSMQVSANNAKGHPVVPEPQSQMKATFVL
jgi:hypothetical protein